MRARSDRKYGEAGIRGDRGTGDGDLNAVAFRFHGDRRTASVRSEIPQPLPSFATIRRTSRRYFLPGEMPRALGARGCGRWESGPECVPSVVTRFVAGSDVGRSPLDSSLVAWG